MITVIDAGIGNLGSVQNMIRKVGGTTTRASDAAGVHAAEKLILPGVGAFGHGMEQLHSHGVVNAIIEKARGGTPLLGICLGMQLLAKDSEEDDVRAWASSTRTSAALLFLQKRRWSSRTSAGAT